MRGHCDGAHTWSAAAMRDAEGLVQVEMADIGTDATGRGQPDLRVHVRTIHVNLAAMFMRELADLDDALLKHAVRGRIGDHQRGHLALVRLQLRARGRRGTLP
jgi:hypothetical protein